VIRGTIHAGGASFSHDPASLRRFSTGATRDTDTGKPDFEGFLSPLTLRRYGEYMHSHRVQPDGSVRDSDNWQRGIPLDAYMKSAFRHFLDAWSEHRGVKTEAGLEESLCALIFNASGYLHEVLKAKANADGIPQAKVDHFWSVMEREAKDRFSDDFQKEDRGSGV